MPADPTIRAALDDAEDELWNTYQASGIASEAMQGITIEQLRRWAVTKGEGNAAARTLKLVRAETAAAVKTFLRALPGAGPLPTAKWLAAAVEEAARHE